MQLCTVDIEPYPSTYRQDEEHCVNHISPPGEPPGGQYTATRCIDYVVEGLQAYTGVTIVSGKSEVIKYQLVNKLGRGITVYKGERGFLPGKYDISNDCDIIFTIITRLEFRKLKNLVYEIDPQAFIFSNEIKEAAGGIIKRRSH